MDAAQYVPSPLTVSPPSRVQPTQNISQYCPKHHFGWRKMVGITVVAVFLMFVWTWLSSPMIVTVTGTGETTVPATGVTISFNVLSSDTTAQGAINSVTAKANTIHTMLLTNGISESNIVQTQVTATPVLSAGYQTTIQMAAKTSSVSVVPALISTLYSNGASSVSQPVFVVENQKDLQAKAFEDAMKDTDTQAATIARTHWKLVRKIINVSQTSSGTTSTTSSKVDPTGIDATQQTAPNGVFKIVQNVSVSYKMW